MLQEESALTEAGDCYFSSMLMNTDVAEKPLRAQGRTKMLINALYCEEMSIRGLTKFNNWNF